MSNIYPEHPSAGSVKGFRNYGSKFISLHGNYFSVYWEW